MSISYSLAPNPKWYIADLVGKPLSGGYFCTFSNLDHTLLNPVFQDPAGLYAWPYVTVPNVGVLGILFDENGSQGQFYFKFDSDVPDQLYYLEVYDSDGVLQWSIDDFAPFGGSGGGGIITEAFNLQNLIVNSVMWKNIGEIPVSPGNFLKLCSGSHSSLAQTSSNAGPDICFIKNNSSATDTISFPSFPLGDNPFTGDVTPVDYLRYVCSVAGTSETKKIIQFPITHSVQNLNNNNVTVTIWARATAGTTNITLYFWQFFGDGPSASTPVLFPIETINLSSSWQKFSFQTTIPSVSGKIIGECGNDALFLQVQYPLGNTCTIDFTKPCVYLGNISPSQEYVTYDSINSVINSPRTGSVTSGYDLVAPFGYLLMNDGTIGSSGSSATNRANIDTFPLYNWLWTNVSQPSSNAWCPVTGGLGGSSIDDFIANKSLQLQRVMGRVLGSAGTGLGLTARSLAETLGEQTHTQTIPEMASHHHSAPGGALFSINGPSGEGVSLSPNTLTVFTPNTTDTGGNVPFNIMQPTSFINFFIKL